MNYIWYAAYASNISLKRFSEHIGIEPQNRDFPFTDWMSITGSVRFAGISSRWDGGVAFLDVSGSDVLALRVYHLLPDQFRKIWESENGMSIENWQHIAGDLPFVGQHETVRAEFAEPPDGTNGKYDSAVLLGRRRGEPVFALTTSQNLEPTEPSPKYLETIAEGLRECPIAHASQTPAD